MIAGLPTLSVIVVSRQRPEHLRLCVESLARQTHGALELIVVTDPAGEPSVEHLRGRIKLARFDVANISEARNTGLALAAGDVVAFIDDDAVAEPLWAERLAAPFADPRVSCATGPVLGRNGISPQWTPVRVGRDGLDLPLKDGVLFGPGSDGSAVKTVGTNCAFRRADLVAIGGFDPAFRYYLDETDVNQRLARLGAYTAIAKDAVVHHAAAANATRTQSRAPADLGPVGASVAAFLARHCEPKEREGALAAHRALQESRLRAHAAARRLRRRDIAALLETFDRGAAEPAQSPAPNLRASRMDAPPPFTPLPPPPLTHTVLAGRTWQIRALMAKAKAAAKAGGTVSLYVFSPTGRPHSVRFVRPGIWLQRGGLFGRSDRDTPRLRLVSFPERLSAEVARTEAVRGTPTSAGDAALRRISLKSQDTVGTRA
ncbi:glycosyltransferase family A protein [Roseicyclus sp. F158]|uniref:Glycosyltransferase family A protein n=1 Tax=Tropicimonas omnivorans TaxID=3075590 RepID=A0ABU3DCX4_9RHOB|nr:glycosyltransferase family A protein [Roseicyclus sp. F158]MDT0681561.1 glycosyltransferase family A protein [Roseicyclus sp. F158]